MSSPSLVYLASSSDKVVAVSPASVSEFKAEGESGVLAESALL